MGTNEIIAIIIGVILIARIAMLWVNKHKQKVQASNVPARDAMANKSVSPTGESSSEKLGQNRRFWRLSNRDNQTAKKLMRTELIGYVVNEALLIALTSVGFYYLYASVVASEAGLMVKFLANDFLTFKDRRTGSGIVRLLKFNLIGLVGMGINLTILYLATTYLHLPYSVANLLGIAAGVPLFFLHFRFTWKKTTKEGRDKKNTPDLEEYR
jgi:putative flippase GtrA